jgi:hypothetical protein
MNEVIATLFGMKVVPNSRPRECASIELQMTSSLAFIYIARHRQVFADIADTPDALDIV